MESPQGETSGTFSICRHGHGLISGIEVLGFEATYCSILSDRAGVLLFRFIRDVSFIRST